MALGEPASQAGGTPDPVPTTRGAGCAYRGQLVELAEELVQQLHQLLGSALGRQARETHDVREEDAARDTGRCPPPDTARARSGKVAPRATFTQTSL